LNVWHNNNNQLYQEIFLFKLFKQSDSVTTVYAAAFRDLIGTSRKFSIALLTYFDRTGFTLRVGDIRRLRAHRG
jgi:hypothetical protein